MPCEFAGLVNVEDKLSNINDCNFLYYICRVSKDSLPSPPALPSASSASPTNEAGGGAASSSAKEKGDLASGSAVICGEGGVYYDVRTNLEDDGGFSTFCLMVDRYVG